MSSRAGRPPVMTDVARLAGVSYQTVSRVLNGAAGVRPETRARVLAAIADLGYRPNRVARALVTGRSHTLGVISFDTTLYGPASTLFGVEQAARAEGYFVSIASLPRLDRSAVVEAIDYLSGQAVEGIVIIAPLASAAAALADLPHATPLVVVGGSADLAVPVVAIDQATGAREATEHLLGLGHRQVWHLAGPPDWLESESRIAGWRSALAAAGVDPPPLARGDWSARSGFAAGPGLVDDPAVTAVFVANDSMAFGLLRAFAEAGRRVPDEVSLVGFDDVPEAEFWVPPLTTVRQDFGAVGRGSLSALLDQIAGGDGASRTVVPAQLIRRRSATAPPGSR